MSRMVGFSRSRTGQHIGARIFLGVVILFLFAPGIVVVAFSFNASPSLAFPFTGVTGRWYSQIFQDQEVIQALQHSAIVAVSTALVAVPLGVSFAFGALRLPPRIRGIMLTGVLIPLVLPVLMIAIGLAIFYNVTKVPLGLQAVIGGHVLISLPFVILTMNASLEIFPFSILDAAYDLGASGPQAFWTITFPLIRPAIEGAALLAMASSIDEFLIALFTAGNQQTLPMLVFARIRTNIDPSVNVLATLMILATSVLAMVAAQRATVRR